MTTARWAAVLDVDKIDGGPEAHYRYRLTTSSEQADVAMDLRVDVSIHADVLASMCGALQTSAEQADHSKWLRKNGELLYRMLLPGDSQQARGLATRLAGWHGPLVISTNDIEVPWELVHDGVDFLGTRLALGRQIVTSKQFHEGRPIGPVGETRRVLIVSNPTGDLGAADEEAAGMARFLGDRGIECKLLEREKANFLDIIHELASGIYDIFHYSGHVGTDESGQAGLQLNDQYLRVEAIRRSVISPRGDGPTGIPPVVFLNGCRSAENLSSVCRAFLDMGSRIIVGTRYPVIDSAAQAFAESWYTGLLAGMTAGEALQEARNAQRRGPTGTWASFVLFGQPAIRLWEPSPERGTPPDQAPPGTAADEGDAAAGREREPKPEPRPHAHLSDPPWDRHARHLDAGAQGLLRKIIDSARGFGVVTSFHLAAGLVTADTPLTSAVEAADIEPLWLTEILTLGQDRAGTDAAGSPGPTQNVRDVLDRAAQLARAGGRAAAGVDDLVSAFADTGGGRAGEVLSMLGVDLGTSGSLFAQSGAFREHYLAPETQRAVYRARLLAAAKGEVISSYSLLLGFALSGSPILRESLLDQGTAGEAVVRALFPEASQLTLPDFSRRAALSFERALEAGRKAGGGPISDGVILSEVLADPESAACQLLTRLGVDLARLRVSLTDSTARNHTMGGEAAP